MVPKQETMEGDQPVQSYSHTQQSLQLMQEHCPGENRTPFVSFPGCF